MAIETDQKSSSDGKVWGFFKLPFRQTRNTTSTTSSSSAQTQPHLEGSNHHASANSVSSVAKSLLPTRRRLKLDPANKLYFPYEPGKQVRSAVRIKNTSKSYTAFKFQTTAPKSCFMRPPGAILAPGESIIATVFKFVEQPENNEKPMDQKSKVKFKIMSLKVKGPMEYVPELGKHDFQSILWVVWLHLFDAQLRIFFYHFDEQKDQVAIEQILRVVFLDPKRPCPALEKLKRQLADADAAVEARKKPPEDAGPRIIGEGLVIDEWKERRERYLARQQIEGVDSA
ncbi:vesicle-associated protein 4-2 isoform X1 [Gossypium hirsutum]|uniref:Vesicle-associated protein 4-2 isoform X1 n=1 Tax=Gossypium hirsutum TaxID=3635 RepID=A0A1U8J0M4_GOSHI|nr:vesicle-associated protein 4-2 isoform X1 [Gossypium hirsutum]